MSVHTSFDNATHVTRSEKLPPVVLRFAPLKPKQLARFNMHDRRSGGDLSHVDLTRKSLNGIEHGHEDWIPKLKRRITRMAERNLKTEVRALKAKGRIAEARRRQAEGPKPPWHANTDAPLREGILTVNKSWFGGSGVDTWDPKKIEDFRVYAMAFLHAHFPDGQLLYAASHSDEEAFHIHFVTAVWESRTTANRGTQIQLRAAANSLLHDYEHAQDLAGAHFEKLGITRGERRAAARRQARALGAPAPEKRYHVSPSQYREAERRKGQADAEIIREEAIEGCTIALKKTRQRASRDERAARRKARNADAKLVTVQAEVADAAEKLIEIKEACGDAEVAREAAVETAGHILEAARETATKTVRKSRTRAIKDAKIRKADAERQAEAAKAQRRIDEQAAADARHAALSAEVMQHRAQAAVVDLVAKAEKASEALIRDRDARDAVLADLKKAEAARETVDLALETAKANEAAAILSRDMRVAEAAEAEKAKQDAEAATRAAETQERAAQSRADALTSGLDYLVDGVMAYHPGSETKSPTLIFTRAAPADPHAQRDIASRIKPAARLLIRIARAIIDAANTLLTRERAQIARHVQALDIIRSRMGIDASEDLDDLRARYAAGEARIEQPDI